MSEQTKTRLLSPDHAPAQQVTELFTSRAKSWENSRSRILDCREMRRNLKSVPVDADWLAGNEAMIEWVTTFLPERQSIGLNLQNTLGDEQPVISMRARGQSDRAFDDADEAEVFLEGLVRELVDWDEIIGKLAEDSELAVVVIPEPAALEKCPDYLLDLGDDTKSLRKPDPRYERDANGRAADHPDYQGRSERASVKAWREDYKKTLAENLPVTVRLIPATDVAPILVRGQGHQRFECRGLIVRSLMEREELIAEGYRGEFMGTSMTLPKGFDSSRQTGQANQFYLYEAFLYSVDEQTGERTPWIARCVGGMDTTHYNKWIGQEESAVVNLKKEYGLDTLHAGYFWGLHAADDDPDWRGIPLLWPVLNTILGIEGLKTAAKAHAHENAFSGYLAEPSDKVDGSMLVDGHGDLLTWRKPKSGQIAQTPGPVAPWQKATFGDDVKYLIEDAKQSLAAQTPDAQQYGEDNSDSGHAMVVGHELLISAKRQIREGARLLVQFIVESSVEILCGLARGEWEQTNGHGINATIAQDVERTITSTGSTETVSEIIEFKDRWFGNNYRVTARYPAVGNLAERRQAFDDWQAGAGTWDEMRETRGDQHAETTRYLVARDQWLAGPLGQLAISARVAEIRQQKDLAAKLQAQFDGEMAKIGLPTDALAPELQQGAPAAGGMPQGPQPPGSPMALPDMAGSSLNGAIQGQMGTAAIQADSAAAMTVNPPAGGA